MKLHRNAALSWSGRLLLAVRVVEQGWTLTAAAGAAGVSVRCARKWVGRYRLEGEAGLDDRSSAPRRVANRTPADRVAVIEPPRVSWGPFRLVSSFQSIGRFRDPSVVRRPPRTRPVGHRRERCATAGC